jgi:tetratricopeptide (TPR) repeat protein
MALLVDGKYAEAIPVAREGLARLPEEPEGADLPQRTVARWMLGRALIELGRFEDAEKELARVPGAAKTLQPALFAHVHGERGRSARLRKDFPAALREYQTAAAMVGRELPPDHPDGAFALVGIGRVELERGRADLARPPLERAVRILEANGAPLEHAEARFALAQALFMIERAPADSRARDLAREARAAYGRAPRRAPEVHEISAWFEKNAPTVLAP